MQDADHCKLAVEGYLLLAAYGLFGGEGTQ
jgi:hypothetical protein